MIQQQYTLNCRGTALILDRPVVMGILNITPDSFYDGGRYEDPPQALDRAGVMVNEGAAILDLGAFSSRPGAEELSLDAELDRLLPVLHLVIDALPDTLISVDTTRASVAREAFRAGAHIINDISGGTWDPPIMDVCAEFKAPFICMHMQGTPETMQDNPEYTDVTEEILRYFVERLFALRAAGVQDVMIDPGFGFGKTLQHNYELLDKLGVFRFLEVPVVAGVSRKSMICQVLRVSPSRALNGTTALHMLALERGARVLRTHDVREAVETIELYEYFKSCSSDRDQVAG